MKNNRTKLFKHSALFAALTTALYQPVAFSAEEAEVDEEGIEVIQVTATRRSATVQEIPVNITALDGDIMSDQNITELSDIARFVPGLTVQDQGGRSASPIIVRGLNTNSSGPGSDGGTVATYVGESPLSVDLKVLDIDRVEVLIGPQGTLYGAGTLGGAIRYIPNKPILDETSGKVYGGFNSVDEGDTGHEAGFVFNTPIAEDELGLRVAVQTQKNAGFIDYNYIVREPGVSLPDPDWSDASAVSANLTSQADANYDETLTAKFMLRWTPMDEVDALLSYTYQNQDIGARSIVHHNALSADNGLANLVGKYESAYRVPEPLERTTDLLSLEVTADLGFAELTSATSYSTFESDGQRDQTDLLIRLNYSYEEFPAFTAFTREEPENDSLTQELRLVSTADSPLTWIVGYYYNKFEGTGSSKEFTPNFDDYAIDVWGVGGNRRNDDLEYYSISEDTVEESAFFGELSYEVTEQLSVTVGARFYNYEVDSKSATDLPLFYSVFGFNDDDGNRVYYGPDETRLELAGEKVDDDGSLLKLNVSYQVTDDLLTYVTISEGFRIGGANGASACPDNVDEIETQIVCALPNEQVYVADTTQNYEIGFKSTWNRNRIHLNGAAFLVDWNDPQIGGATINGQQPITANGQGARATGFELSARAMLTDELTAFGSYSYAKAELTADAPYLFGVVDLGCDATDAACATEQARLQTWWDGSDGDRLPGAPETQMSLGLKYSTDLTDEYLLDVNFGYTYQSDLITTVGNINGGTTLDGYGLANMSAKISSETWAVSVYVNNLFNEYAETSVRRSIDDVNGSSFDEHFDQNRPDLLRNFGYFIQTPMTVGVKFEYTFESI